MFYYYGKTILDEMPEEEKLEEEQLSQYEVKEKVWDKLKKCYPIEKPWGEDSPFEFLKIPIRDLEYLVSNGSTFAQNSFLLHSYDNYHTLFLTKEVDEEVYYIAVLGNIFHREKMVASLFGFEWKTLCDANEREGMFGYYFQKISLEEYKS